MGAAVPRQRSPAAGVQQSQSLAADDFRDVFGGPPRTVLLSSFYGEPAADHAAAGSYYCYGGVAGHRRPYADGRGGGRIAAAAVPTEEGFFDDIFGARARHVRSRSSRSKSTKSSSVVSSDDFGGSGRRARPDAALSSFASKLRPIAIPSRRYDSSPPSTASTRGDHQYYQSQSSFACSTAAYPACRYYYGGESKSKASGSSSSAASGAGRNYKQQRASGGGFCCFTSNAGETSSHEPSFRRTTQTHRGAEDDDVDYGQYCYSPSSSAASSSLFGNPLSRTTPRRSLEEEAAMMMMMEVRERAPLLMDDDDIDSVGAAAVDEAIAWAKERFWSHDDQ